MNLKPALFAPFVLPSCQCRHLDVFHNLNGHGERTTCSTSSGPDATPCGCRAYTPAEEAA